MQINQYQSESAKTERYADNHRLIANALGALGEIGELTADIIDVVKETEDDQNLSLTPIKNQLMEVKYELLHCGALEKSIRSKGSLGRDATERQQSDFQKMQPVLSPEKVEHIEGEVGDILFHLSRLLASVSVSLEHCMIKNRIKLDRRLANNEIINHQDH